ncbi:MAG: inner membrane-spanning protein YciB [Sphingorhabdus sp.]
MNDKSPAKKGHGALGFALDFGPLLMFFIANHFGKSESDPARGPLIGTMAFMIAITIALIISKWKLGKISPMMWISAILVLGFGGIALMLGEPRYIQIKPTIIYLLFATLLLGGWLRGKSLLKYVLEYAFEGVDEAGWLKLSRNWGLFFLVMAGINEIIRQPQLFSFDTWLTMKVWGMTALSVLFTFSQIPMLMRHGLKVAEVSEEIPPQG